MLIEVFKGNSVSCGIGMGIVYVYEHSKYNIDYRNIKNINIESEFLKLERAFCQTLIEVEDLNNGFKDLLNDKEQKIFEVYSQILADNFLVAEIKDTIKVDKLTAEIAINNCIEKYIQAIRNSENEFYRERAYDLIDLRERLLINLMGSESIKDNKDINNNHIVVVNELTPSLATMLAKKNIRGLVAHEGAGFLSHSAIILRSLGIPTLSNINYYEIKKYNNLYGIIDSKEGIFKIVTEVFDEGFSLKETTMNNYTKAQTSNNEAVTIDGRKINILVNISNMAEFNVAKKMDIDGIGLVRTETLFINHKKIPSEKRQILYYLKIAKTMAGKNVMIRTLDIGNDKIPDYSKCAETDIGKRDRGLKNSLLEKNQLSTQIRAILRSCKFGNVSIVFPMVSNACELKEAKLLINSIEKEMFEEQIEERKHIKIGAVIETINSVNDIDNILTEIDFISIGTNDLAQQVIGVDRNSSTNGQSGFFDLRFLKVLNYIIQKAKSANKNVSICGEMAGDKIGALILIGMGVIDLSMSPYSIEKMKQEIFKINYKEVKEIMNILLLECKDEECVKKLLYDLD